MGYEVQVENISLTRALAVVRRRARPEQFSRVVPECCGVVWNALKAAGARGAGRHVAVYRDDVVNLEVGVEMDGEFAGAGEVESSALPVGLVASTIHFGPYQKLRAAHAAVHEWCGQNGYELAGPKWEIYGHWLEEWNHDPSKIRTDVFYLLK
jgi:effector-binding domain-containing protein